jgi:hypothetical protein
LKENMPLKKDTLASLRSGKCAGIGVLVLLLSLGGCRPAEKEAPNPVVAWVDEEPVTLAEYLVYDREARPRVHAAFHRTYQVADERSFWTSRFGGAQPAEVLRRQVMQTLVAGKVKLQKAKQLGVRFDDNLRAVRGTNRVDDASYAAFEAYYRQYRAAAGSPAAPHVFYGPTDMTPEEKYKEWCGRISMKLEEKVISRMHFEEAELKACFQSNKRLFRTQAEAEPTFEAARTDVKAVLGKARFERVVREWASRASVRTDEAAFRKFIHSQ